MDNLEEGIHIIDHTGKIVYYNNSAEQIDGIDKEKAIGSVGNLSILNRRNKHSHDCNGYGYINI